jgi:hypothetical protein
MAGRATEATLQMASTWVAGETLQPGLYANQVSVTARKLPEGVRLLATDSTFEPTHVELRA